MQIGPSTNDIIITLILQIFRLSEKVHVFVYYFFHWSSFPSNTFLKYCVRCNYSSYKWFPRPVDISLIGLISEKIQFSFFAFNFFSFHCKIKSMKSYFVLDN